MESQGWGTDPWSRPWHQTVLSHRVSSTFEFPCVLPGLDTRARLRICGCRRLDAQGWGTDPWSRPWHQTIPSHCVSSIFELPCVLLGLDAVCVPAYLWMQEVGSTGLGNRPLGPTLALNRLLTTCVFPCPCVSFAPPMRLPSWHSLPVLLLFLPLLYNFANHS